VLFSVESFIGEEERMELLCEAFSATEQKWHGNTDARESYWNGRKLPYISEITKRLDLRLAGYFDNYERISPFHCIQRIPAGDFMGEHNDKNIPSNMYGCVAYINDDFEGGELVFPRLGVSVRPKAGMLVVHSSEEPHMINTVHGKNRYMITCFVYGGPNKEPKIVKPQ